MKYTVMDKAAVVASTRVGETADVYADLVALLEDQPEKKLLIDFENNQRGQRAVLKLAEWATEDILTLYTRHVPGTTKREMHVEHA